VFFTIWRNWFRRLGRLLPAVRKASPPERRRRARPRLEALEDRTLPAVQLALAPAADPFDASARTLLVTAPADQAILLRQADGQAGTLQVVVNGQVEYSGLTSAFANLAIAGGDTLTFEDTLSLAGSMTAQTSAIEIDGSVHAAAIRLFGDRSVQLATGAAVVSPGGDIVLQSSPDGSTVVSGDVDASALALGGVGGTVELLGGKVGLFSGAAADASGDGGGGLVQVGGAFHGAAALPAATQTYVSPSAHVSADALDSGPGGRVVVWADELTRFSGQIEARGGPEGGDGGFVEVSSKNSLGFDGHVDTGATHGNAGSLLLDPKNIIIATGGSTSSAGLDSFATNPSGTVTVDPSALNGAAANTTVTLEANNDITFQNALNFSNSGTNLFARAGRSIVINASITTRAGAIQFTANDPGAQASNRDPGAAVLSMATGTTINTTQGGGGSASIELILGGGPNGNDPSGDITLETLNAGGTFIFLENIGASAGSSIRMTDGSGNLIAPTYQFYIGNTSGSIGTPIAPLLLNVASSSAVSTATAAALGAGGGVFLNYNHSLVLGDANESGVHLLGVSTTGTGAVNVAPVASPATGSLTVSKNVTTTGGSVTLGGTDGFTLNGSATIGTSGGAVTVNANSNNDATGSFIENSGSTINSGGGTVTVQAAAGDSDDVQINGSINSGSGDVHIAPTALTSAMTLGSAGAGFNLSQADLRNVSSSGTVTVGNSGQSGNVTIGLLDLSTNAYNLTVQGNNLTVQRITLADNTTLQLIGLGSLANNAGGSTNVQIGGTSGAALFNFQADVGEAATPINTSVAVLAAQSVTGTGVFINQLGSLTVGSVGTVAGILVQSGKLVTITTGGLLTLTQPISAGTGTVTLNTTSGGVNQTGGSITAGQLLLTGTGTFTVNQGSNAVTTLAASVNGPLTYVNSSDLGIGTVGTTKGVVSGSNAIDISTINGNLTVANTAAAVDVDAGTSTLRLAAGGLNKVLTISTGAAVAGTGGLTFVGDNMTLAGTATAGTATASLQPFSPGQLINLGGSSSAGTLGLTAAQLNNITAGTLRIGNATAGNITISAPFSLGSIPTLSLQTGGTINESAGASLTVTNLALRSVGAISLGASNSATVLAASISGAGNAFQFTDPTALTIGSVDGVNGISTNNGAITVTTNTGGLTVNDTPASSDINAGTSTVLLQALGTNQLLTIASMANVAGTGGVTLVADNMNLAGTVSAGSATATLQEVTFGQQINLGGADGVGTLGLSAPELNNLNAGLVKIGDARTGITTVSAAIAPAGTTALSIQSGSSITQVGGATISVGSLALRAAGAITLTEANVVQTLAASVTAPPAALQFSDNTGLTVGSVDGVDGIATTNGAITLTTTAGGLTINNTPAAADVNAGTSTVTLQVLARDQLLTVAGGANVSGVSGVTLIADQMNLTGTVTASGATASAVLHQATAGQLINLGAASVGGTLGLTAAAINNVTAATVKIGDINSGDLTVSAPLAVTSTAVLSLQTGGVLSQAAASPIGVTNLALRAGDISLMGANNVTTLAAFASGPGNAFQFTNSTGLTVGSVDGLDGINSTNGNISLITTTGLLRISNTPAAADVNAGSGTVFLQAQGAGQTLDIAPSANVTGTNGVTLSADVITLDGSVTATGATALLEPFTPGHAINLGAADTALALGLSAAELNAVTASILKVGNSTSGNLAVASAIAPAHAPTLSLQTGGTITQAAGATLTATNLALRAGGAITLTENNDAGILAATTSAGDLQYTDVNALSVGTADSLVGVVVTNGSVTIKAGGTLDTSAGPVTAGGTGHTVTLTTTGGGNINAGAITAAGGTVTLTAAGAILNGLAAGVNVTATNLVMTAGSGIASAGSPLQTAISNLEAAGGSGGVFVANASALTIGGPGPVVGVSAIGGNIQLSAVGPLIVGENVTTPGNITLTAAERVPPGPGDDLTVNPGVTVRSTAAAVTLQAGDLVNVPAGATARAAAALTLVTGFNDNDGIGGMTLAGTLIGSPIALLGGPGNDTFTIIGTTTGPLTLDGRNGSDTYLITFGALGGPVTINDTGTTGTDRVVLTGTAGADTITVTSTAVTWNGVETVNYAGVEALAVNAGDGNDTLQVLSTAASTPVTVDGQGGDDTYQVALGSLASALTVSDSAPSPHDTLTVTGTPGADSIAVSATAVTWNGTQMVNYQGIATVTVLGGDGNDQISVTSTSTPVTLDGQGGSNSYQIAFGALAAPVTVADSGGSGSNALTVSGTSATNTLVVNAASVVWNGTEMVNYSGVQSLLVNGGSGADTLQVNSTAAGTTVTLDGQGGSDTYQVMLGALAGPVAVSDSGSSGTDAVTVTGTPGNDSLQITATSVTWNGTQTVTYAGVEALTVNAGDGNDTIVVSSTAATTPVTVNGQGGDDAFVVSSPSAVALDTLASPLTLDGGTGSNSLTVTQANLTAPDNITLTSSSISDSLAHFLINYQATGGSFGGGVTFQGGSGNNVVNVQSTLAGATTTVRTGASADTIIVSSNLSAAAGVLSGLAGPLMIDAGGGANTLIVSEAASTKADSVIMTASTITGVSFALTYQATGGSFGGGVSLYTGSGNDAVYVQGTPAGAATNVFTGAGDDTVSVSSSLNLAAGVLTGLGGPLTVDEGPGNNRLVVSEAGRSTPDRVFFTNVGIAGTSPSFLILYKATGGNFSHGVDFVAGSGNDTLIVQSKLAGVPMAIYAGLGDDTFDVGVTSASGYSGLTVDGGGGNNFLFTFDQSGGAVMQQIPFGPGQGQVRVAYLAGATSIISYQNIANVTNSVDPNSSFIQALYHAEIGWNASPDAISYWLGVMAQGGQAAVAQGIHDSGAARTHRVLGWYSTFFGYQPTDGGEQFWVALLNSFNEEQVMSAFLGSDGYFAQVGFSNANFLQKLYNDLLGRLPGPSEQQLYLGTLLPGAGRPGTALLVLTSAEYRTLQVKALYANLLHYSPSDADLAFWVNSALSLSQIDVMIESSDAFFRAGG
jgi:hypothetical protein